ncbi:MAG: hypothetical protein WA666_10345 [Nitrospirota bacterium]
MKKFVLKFMLAGGLIPIFFLLMWKANLDQFYGNNVQLILWPVSIVLIAVNEFDIVVYSILILINALLYGIIGIFIWFCLSLFKKAKLKLKSDSSLRSE